MTKNQALALLNALESAQMSGSVILAFDATKTETWSAQLSSSHIYSGPELASIASYCATNGLTLSIQVESMGIL